MNNSAYDYTDFSESALLARGEYLVTVVDNIPGKATAQDIANLPAGKVVIPWGPGAGKSSAIRKFLVESKLGWYVYATYTVEEVEKFYYDIISHLTYAKYHPELNITRKPEDVKYFTSHHNYSSSELQTTPIIICTHERLLIEPPKLLYKINDPSVEYRSMRDLRNAVYIDELSGGYKEYKIDEVRQGLLMNSYNNFTHNQQLSLESNSTQWTEEAYQYLIKLFSSQYDNTNNLSDKIMNLAYNNILKDNIAINKSSSSVNEVVDRKSHFMMHILTKFIELTKSPDYDPSIGCSIFYSLIDVANYVNNVYIFDGTGDISMRDSSVWKIAPNKFERKLLLNHYPKIIPNTDLSRSIKYDHNDQDNLPEEFYNCLSAIRHLTTIHHKILIYTWRSFKITECYSDSESDESVDLLYKCENLPNLIRDNLTDEENSKIEVIYYQSGKDKFTSEYADCDAIFIIGKFLLPNYALTKLNKVRGTNITNKDYMLNLIIQAIARTQMRVGKPIDIYLNSNFSNSDILAILQGYPLATVDNYDYHSEISDRSSMLMSSDYVNEKILKIREFITNEDNYKKLLTEELVLTSKDISNITGVKSSHTIRYSNPDDYDLPGLSIEVIPGKRGRYSSPTKFIFKLDLLGLLLD